MTNRKFRTRSRWSAVAPLGMALGIFLAVQSPATALNGEKQLLSGGFNQGANVTTIYTSPGFSTALGIDNPSAGDGENAVQLRLHKGTLSFLKVRVRTGNVPTSGSMTVTVRINGADTVLTCTVTGTGNCGTGKNKKVAVKTNDRLAIKIDSDLADEGNMTLTYTLLYD